MDGKTRQSVSFALDVARLQLEAGGLDRIGCLKCWSLLNIHQPEAEEPDRLLATCEQCGEWYMVELGSEHDAAFLIRIPGSEELDVVQGTPDSGKG